MSTNVNLVQRLWGLCNILRDDGITYQDYVTESHLPAVPQDARGDRARGTDPSRLPVCPA